MRAMSIKVSRDGRRVVFSAGDHGGGRRLPQHLTQLALSGSPIVSAALPAVLPVNSPAMAQRQSKTERFLPERPFAALHRFGHLFDGRFASRVRPQFSQVCL